MIQKMFFLLILIPLISDGTDLIQDTGSETELTTLTVKVTGLDSDDGRLYLGLYASNDNWLKTPFRSGTTEVIDGQAMKVYEDIPEGYYGISSYHDENLNKELDSGLFGIPTEPWACSREAKGRFGPPKWKDARFKVTGLTQEVTIKY